MFALLSCFRDDQAVCLHHVLPYSELSTLGQLRFLYWTGNIPGTENSCKCNRTNSFWPKSPYASGIESAISGFGPSSYSLYLSSLVCGGCSGRSLGVGPSLAGLAGAARSVLKLVMKAPI